MRKVLKLLLWGYFVVVLLYILWYILLNYYIDSWAILEGLYWVSLLYLLFVIFVFLVFKYIVFTNLKNWQKWSIIFFVFALCQIVFNFSEWLWVFKLWELIESFLYAFNFVNFIPTFLSWKIANIFWVNRLSSDAVAITLIFVTIFNILYGGILWILHDKIAKFKHNKTVSLIIFYFMVVVILHVIVVVWLIIKDLSPIFW